MTAKILDGNAVARQVRAEWKKRVGALKARGVTPGLAVIIVGNNPASRVYVRNKTKACAEVGLHSETHKFPPDVGEDAVLQRIRELIQNPHIHGIFVQLPLPRQINARHLLGAIAVEKDVDGFHLYNVGGLVVGENIIFPPCTPYGVQCLLEYENIPIEGQNVVVVGASNIVGKPMALMLIAKDATVSICHIKTRDLAQYTILADILIVAAGFITAMIIGIPFGLLLAVNRTAFGIGFPVFEVLRPIPPLAWVPASIIFWPTQEMSIAFVTFLGAFYTIVINVVGGAKSIDVRYFQAAQSMGSSNWDIFRRIILPGTLPSIMVGSAVGMGITWEVVVAAEMISGGGSQIGGTSGGGLGFYIWNSYVGGSYEQIVVGMTSIGIAGYISSELLRALGKRVTPWLRLR